MKVPLCNVTDIPEEGALQVDFFGREVLVYRAYGHPKAVLNYCAHLGGPMKREGEQLVCQWHGAAFECRGGRCLKGPARPESMLIQLPVRIEDGILQYVYGE